MFCLHCRNAHSNEHAASSHGSVRHADRDIANTWLPVLLHVGRLQGLGAVPLVLSLLLFQRSLAYHLPHGVHLANCRARSSEVRHSFPSLTSVYIKLLFVCLSVCLCVCLSDFSETCGPISMKLFMVHNGHT